MKILSEKESRENIDYYSDMVFEEKVTIMIKFEKGKCVYLKPVDENETR